MILKVKGKKALIDLEGESAQKNDKFSALNLYGKTQGILQIKKVKRGKAIAVLKKGKMGVNWILEPTADEAVTQRRSIASTSTDFGEEEEDYDNEARQVRTKPFANSGLGLIGGYHLNMLTVKKGVNAYGHSFKAALMVDFTIANPLAARVFLGYQNLYIDGSGKCGRSNCKLIIHYPGAGFLLRAVFLKKNMAQPWVGLGGFLFWPLPITGADMGLDKKSFESFHGAVTGGFGLDIHFDDFYIPLQADISLINPVSIYATKSTATSFTPIYIGAKIGLVFAL